MSPNTSHAEQLPAMPSVALHYGAQPPLGDLQAFDIVVIEPDHGAAPRQQDYPNTRFYAYASVTEVQRSRPYYSKIPTAWKLGRNGDWNSEIVDQSASAWPDFFASEVIAPLWNRGFRGFFLDTMDSYRLARQFDEAAQQAGMVRVIETLHQRFPGIQLIFNRGFDIIGKLPGKVQMVAAESLYQRWNAGAQRYEEVPAADRAWLTQQLRTVQQRDGIPAIVIDYAPPSNRQQTRDIARRIQADGFIPWVTDSGLSTVGIGSTEVVPRHILVLYNGSESPALSYSSAHRFLQMPLNHMGYVVDYADTRLPLPHHVFQDQYAGVITWFSGDIDSKARVNLKAWLTQRVNEQMPLAIMGDFGFGLDAAWARSMGLDINVPPAQDILTPISNDPMLGFEQSLRPVNTDFPALRLLDTKASRSLIELIDNNKNTYTGGAITAWGGFLMEPFTLVEVPGSEQFRWVTDPFAFVTQALRLASMPIPDITTENGRRLLLAHIDGDSFASHAELQGSPYSAQTLFDDILKKYRIPHAVSVIEGEISAHGLYPQSSKAMEAIAREIFSLPHIELASHTYSHPFLWDRSVKHGVFSGSHEAAYNLPIPSYEVDLYREIAGSANYINQQLAPTGKRTKILLWSGDTSPSAEALKIAYDANLLNMNGGDTQIRQAYPSLTAIGPLGIMKKGLLQVYAPITNENIYTNLWTGPFYGFQQVLETFAMTDTPRRIKPVGIYYHTYSTSKRAGLLALEKVYRWAISHPLHPIFASDYIRKVQDFYSYSIAKKDNAWQIRGQGYLRTLRWPDSLGKPSLLNSAGIAGSSAGIEGRYVHLTNQQALITTQNPQASAEKIPYLYAVNARLHQWSANAQKSTFQMQLRGNVTPIELDLAIHPGCRVTADQQPIKGTSIGNNPLDARQELLHFSINHASTQIQVQCQPG